MMFTYPRFEVEIERRVDVDRLGSPSAQAAEDESTLGGNRAYVDLRELSWAEASRIHDLEGELMARIEAAADADEEYLTIDEELYEDPCATYGLDIGVASTVAALSAAGCLPFSSCNAGALGGMDHESHPVVVFFAPPDIVPVLMEVAAVTDVGLSNEDGGALIVYSADIRFMRDFANKLIGQAASLSAA